ncbi:MAG: type II toxin-antitoxin system HicB family antitoxin [Candidatus Aminicenantes bacterium]|nr:type II toxin-antitoxin system HicB family antitoxin [Candidatus Aminicenantes bacterium]
MKKKDIDYYMNLPYKIVIQKDPHGGFFAKVEELEGCMTQGEIYDETSRNIVEAMELWLESSLEMGIDIPEPDVVSRYSGKFILRLPKSLHRKLAEKAKKENVSLNQYAVHLLSERNVLRQP